MTPDEEFRTIEAMKTYGGSFAKALAVAYECGDGDNRAKIRATWPDYFGHYYAIGDRQRRREAEASGQ